MTLILALIDLPQMPLWCYARGTRP